jgi:organic radical activating enzyme
MELQELVERINNWKNQQTATVSDSAGEPELHAVTEETEPAEKEAIAAESNIASENEITAEQADESTASDNGEMVSEGYENAEEVIEEAPSSEDLQNSEDSVLVEASQEQIIPETTQEIDELEVLEEEKVQ